MEPSAEHAFYAWLIVVSAVCIVTLIGATIDSLFLNRRLRRKCVKTISRPEERSSNEPKI